MRVLPPAPHSAEDSFEQAAGIFRQGFGRSLTDDIHTLAHRLNPQGTTDIPRTSSCRKLPRPCRLRKWARHSARRRGTAAGLSSATGLSIHLCEGRHFGGPCRGARGSAAGDGASKAYGAAKAKWRGTRHRCAAMLPSCRAQATQRRKRPVTQRRVSKSWACATRSEPSDVSIQWDR